MQSKAAKVRRTELLAGSAPLTGCYIYNSGANVTTKYCIAGFVARDASS